MSIARRLCLLPLALLLFLGPAVSGAYARSAQPTFNADRARLLSYVLREELSRNHYSHKPIDDTFSKEAFGLYLKQLDAQKLFLLQPDVAQLRTFATKIDDELKQGRPELPAVAARIMGARVLAVQKMVDSLLTGHFDFRRQETLQTDPEKRAFCATDAALRERWRKTLKYQIELRLLDLQAAAKGDKKKADAAPDTLRHKALEKVRKSYTDFFFRLRQQTKEDYYDRYFNAIARTFDPHTDYLPPVAKQDFDIDMSGSLEGIGATLREEDGYIKVVSIIPGSPAFRQGQLHAEDTILQVAQGKKAPTDLVGMRLRDAVSLIRGPKGTLVRLTVRRPSGTHLVIPIVRGVVKIEATFVKGTTLVDPRSHRRYGYIDLPSFYRDFRDPAHGGTGRNCTEDMRKELAVLAKKHIAGLVLDLRNNGGGALTDAVSIAGLFIKTGPVVQVRSSSGKIQVLADKDPAIAYRGPMIVLVNQFSASASEILAGAMQDYDRAVIVGGAHTHGKGTVQAVLDLDQAVPFRNMDRYKPLGALKITIQKFYRISGASTQYRGIIPDIVLPGTLQYLKTGEKYLPYSLPWDTVAPTHYQRWHGNYSYDLPLLRRDARHFVAQDKEFTAIAEEAQETKERMEHTRQSLLLSDLRRQRQQDERLAAQAGDKSPHGMHGRLGAGKENGKKPLSKATKHRDWVKALDTDPYIQVSLDLLDAVRSGSAPPVHLTAEDKTGAR